MKWQRDGLILDLRKPELDDLDILTHWIGSPDFVKQVAGTPSESNDGARAMAERIVQNNADDQCLNRAFLAVDRQDETPIGLVLICNIDWKTGMLNMRTSSDRCATAERWPQAT